MCKDYRRDLRVSGKESEPANIMQRVFLEAMPRNISTSKMLRYKYAMLYILRLIIDLHLLLAS